jgi:hypothetical protein
MRKSKIIKLLLLFSDYRFYQPGIKNNIISFYKQYNTKTLKQVLKTKIHKLKKLRIKYGYRKTNSL